MTSKLIAETNRKVLKMEARNVLEEGRERGEWGAKQNASKA